MAKPITQAVEEAVEEAVESMAETEDETETEDEPEVKKEEPEKLDAQAELIVRRISDAVTKSVAELLKPKSTPKPKAVSSKAKATPVTKKAGLPSILSIFGGRG